MTFLPNTQENELTETELLRWGFCEALAKAHVDEFDYALGLRDGTVMFFSRVSYERGSAWVHLHAHQSAEANWGSYIDNARLLRIPFERGVDVRLSDIVWVADAPFGS